MPLPDDNPEWPPKDTQIPLGFYEEWGAWYSGSTKQLAKVYGAYFSAATLLAPKLDIRPSGFYQGGIVGYVERKFWGSPPPGGALTSSRLHIPLAGDIAATSADLLFGDELKVLAVTDAPEDSVGDDGEQALPYGASAVDKATQERIEEILDGGAFAVFLEAAEIAAAYGGVYIRAGWDPEMAEHVLFDAIPPDSGIPEWRSGRLRAVTFWKEVNRDGGKVWRHLERHEVAKGVGVIWHALYLGTDDHLGDQVPLTDQPETAPFADLVGSQGFVATGAKRLDVVYVPNMRPNRHPDLRGSNLGRSDYASIAGVMDALDEAWTSWMRDVRLGKGRIVAPDSYLSSRGRGKGAYFDMEREVFETVAALSSADGGLQLQVVQFAIRVQEHQQTCQALTEEAIRGAGYSTSTFGMVGDVAQTATENTNRKERSTVTRARKIRYWTPELRRLFLAALEIDVAQFKSKITPTPPMIEFPDAAGVDPASQAQTLQMLRAAEVISMRSAVAQLHPDWEQSQIDEEVARIQAEAQQMAAAGVQVGGPGEAQPQLDGDGQPLDAGDTGDSGGQQPPTDAFPGSNGFRNQGAPGTAETQFVGSPSAAAGGR